MSQVLEFKWEIGRRFIRVVGSFWDVYEVTGQNKAKLVGMFTSWSEADAVMRSQDQHLGKHDE